MNPSKLTCTHRLQMKDDFQRLEDDMSHLGSKVDEITASSASINRALADRKREISKLCGVHHLLKKVSLSLSFTLSLTLSLCSPPPCPSLISRSHLFPCSYIFFSLQLQFLFELPTRLKKCIEMGFYGQAVR